MYSDNAAKSVGLQLQELTCSYLGHYRKLIKHWQFELAAHSSKRHPITKIDVLITRREMNNRWFGQG